MSNTAPAALSSIGTVIRNLFPWITWLTSDAKSGGLRVRSESGKVHLAGGDGDPAAARVGDSAGYLYAVVTLGAVSAVYWSPGNGTASSWTLIASGPVPPVNGVTVGTGITISSGSAKVTAA